MVEINQTIEDLIKKELTPILEQWSGLKLEWTKIYGIRNYLRDSYLKMHVDRYQTHIISVIINISQKVDVDWPLVFIDNYGRTNHLILKPGEVIYYESALCYHGRPYPFKGDEFANIFCHTRPINWPHTIKNIEKMIIDDKIRIENKNIKF